LSVAHRSRCHFLRAITDYAAALSRTTGRPLTLQDICSAMSKCLGERSRRQTCVKPGTVRSGRSTRVSLASDAVVCGSGTTGLRTVVPAVTLHGSLRCRATGLCCARSAPKVLRTFRISGSDLAECEFEAACVDCGGTVGLGGARTRTGQTATRPHLGHNLDAGRAVSVSRLARTRPTRRRRRTTGAPHAFVTVT
jgi:hypothetical protein